MNTVEQKQAELQQAWAALQAVPSYVEQQAAAFAAEPVEEQQAEEKMR